VSGVFDSEDGPSFASVCEALLDGLAFCAGRWSVLVFCDNSSDSGFNGEATTVPVKILVTVDISVWLNLVELDELETCERRSRTVGFDQSKSFVRSHD
jgi:hypothetical protein